MTIRASLALGGALLGASLAIALPVHADPPIGDPATVYVTVHETRTVDRRYQGRTAHQWARHAVANRRALNVGHAREQRLARRVRAVSRAARLRYAPTVDYAIRLASSVYGVPYSKMRAVAYCESTLNPYADNGRYHGLFQLGWAPFGFSPYDPVASALSTAQTVVHDGGWRQWSCG